MWVRGIVLGLCLGSVTGAWAQFNAYPEGRDTFVPVRLKRTNGVASAQLLNNANQVFSYFGKTKGYLYGADAAPGHRVNALSSYRDLNAAEQLAGAVPAASGRNSYRAAITGPAGQGVQLLQGLEAYASSEAVAFSANGRIAGNFKAPYLSKANAFVTSPGSLVAVPIPMIRGGAQSVAYGVNSAGQVAGTYVSTSGYATAFVTSENGGQMIPLVVSAGFVGMSAAYAINESGQVVGCQEVAPGVTKGYITDPVTHVMRALDTSSPGCAEAINSEGRVVGTHQVGRFDVAMLTGRNGVGVYDLNDLIPKGSVSSALSFAWRINDSGRVLAFANNGDKYLLIPKKPLP